VTIASVLDGASDATQAALALHGCACFRSNRPWRRRCAPSSTRRSAPGRSPRRRRAEASGGPSMGQARIPRGRIGVAANDGAFASGRT
jgi:hypothetical protein